ncbi:MAG: hypothetical protein ACYDIE_02570, partial [Candidatus Krumholzibacteriia bacterium]
GLPLLTFLLTLGGGGGARAAIEIVTPTGIRAVVHDAGEVTRRWVVTEGATVRFRHPTAGDLELLSGPDDPRLTRVDDEPFVPLDPEAVAGAIGGFEMIAPQVSVEIFLLPAPPVATLGSFARRDAIFLSPGFGPVPAATLAALVAHELGHVLTWGYLDPRPARWDAWRQRRGLAPDAGGATAPHAERAREILAEDIRCLFGGPLARQGQAPENGELPAPEAVAGLREELASWLVGAPLLPVAMPARAVPNPSRAGVAIEVAWPVAAAGAAVTAGAAGPPTARLEVFDLRGRRVAGGGEARFANGRLELVWDGRDFAGRPVAAGPYVYAVSWPGGAARGTLIRAR